jgi:hypothetical protein
MPDPARSAKEKNLKGKDPGLQHGDLKGVVEAGVAEAGASGGQQVARVLNTGLAIKNPPKKPKKTN